MNKIVHSTCILFSNTILKSQKRLVRIWITLEINLLWPSTWFLYINDLQGLFPRLQLEIFNPLHQYLSCVDSWPRFSRHISNSKCSFFRKNATKNNFCKSSRDRCSTVWSRFHSLLQNTSELTPIKLQSLAWSVLCQI